MTFLLLLSVALIADDLLSLAIEVFGLVMQLILLALLHTSRVAAENKALAIVSFLTDFAIVTFLASYIVFTVHGVVGRFFEQLIVLVLGLAYRSCHSLISCTGDYKLCYAG